MRSVHPLRLLFAVTPKRLLTVAAGRLLRSPLSRTLIPLFVLRYGVDAGEAEKRPLEYGSLSEFFARRLCSGARPFFPDDAVVVSPVDGVVTQRGLVTAGRMVQVKGMDYLLTELLGEPATVFEGGDYLVVYLSPRDYHRIHAPFTASIDRVLRFPGTFFPVNRWGVRSVPRLHARNERVVTWLSRGHAPTALVKVGSLMVGSVRLSPGQFPVTDDCRPVSGDPIQVLTKPHSTYQGQEMAWFEFGSTVILVFSPQRVRLFPVPGERVKALQPIGVWVDA